ncbi:MAG: glycosyltransferase family 4 protein [Magnetococcales bacterium]|nr:glycosyltransferase family 4 protein [Magnetococcales bacterium]MBF0116351.1 glycosyltransferase family 4 protein [Magnetococcales bacterium]
MTINTSSPRRILFLQNRSHKAGAQTCLWRMLVQCRQQGVWEPLLVTSRAGWLTEACATEGIPCLIHPFPSSRSLWGRLYGNGHFVKQVLDRVAAQNFQPQLVQGNDYSEGLLTLLMAKRLQVPASVLLRDPRLRRGDYFKYGCDRCNLVVTIGETLQQAVAGWDATHSIHAVHDGVLSHEVLTPRLVQAAFPQQILVIGSHLPHKGWLDMVRALLHLEQKGFVFSGLRFDFTGVADEKSNPLPVQCLQSCTTRFLGRVDSFQALLQQYDLVINPSRQETFGMAAVETIAAGTSLLSSRSGIIEQVIEDPRFLYPPGDVEQLADRLEQILLHWPDVGLDLASCQKNIVNRFHVMQTISKIEHLYQKLHDS